MSNHQNVYHSKAKCISFNLIHNICDLYKVSFEIISEFFGLESYILYTFSTLVVFLIILRRFKIAGFQKLHHYFVLNIAHYESTFVR
ncbi:hypothetical protein BpHYR1_021918 [Brachionus plicatilis]|uniref:Uncharacterized protein n=1 Tax=Brachionus plicatilis TaxID=10195 RepID=A0A3M7PLR7_BRAPC|nr:hypothetical protein BpHYR1_021918 [Brachionus plicatilis]